MTNMYIWGLDLSGSIQGAGGVGGLLTRYVPVSNALDYVFCDANGNVTELVNTNGDVDAHYEYDPYGSPRYAETDKGPTLTIDLEAVMEYVGQTAS